MPAEAKPWVDAVIAPRDPRIKAGDGTPPAAKN